MQVVVILYCLGISFLEFFFRVGIFDLQLVECGTQRNRRPAWLSQRWCLSKICGENPYRALSVRTGEVSGAHDSHQSSVTPNSEMHLSYSPRILRRWAGSLSLVLTPWPSLHGCHLGHCLFAEEEEKVVDQALAHHSPKRVSWPRLPPGGHRLGARRKPGFLENIQRLLHTLTYSFSLNEIIKLFSIWKSSNPLLSSRILDSYCSFSPRQPAPQNAH